MNLKPLPGSPHMGKEARMTRMSVRHRPSMENLESRQVLSSGGTHRGCPVHA